tara:strand:+ start:1418 stop:1768 length:351 start_codon:yes stop_codon:yes gene_type:complete
MMESDSSQLGPNALMFAEHVMAIFDWAEIDPEPYHPIICSRKKDNAVGFAIATRPHDFNSILHCFEDGVEGFHAENGVSLLISEDQPATMAAIAAAVVILTNQPAGDALTKLAEEK